MTNKLKSYAVYVEGISTPYFVDAKRKDSARRFIESQGQRVMWVILRSKLTK